MKKLFAMILSVVMILSLFAGCGGAAQASDLAYIKDKTEDEKREIEKWKKRN